jgi:ubiquitin-conjugating enzyme E2 M
MVKDPPRLRQGKSGRPVKSASKKVSGLCLQNDTLCCKRYSSITDCTIHVFILPSFVSELFLNCAVCIPPYDPIFFLFLCQYYTTDIAELDGGKVATIHFPNPNDLTTFDVSISPDSGYWKGATSPPKVECLTKIYHPNIDLQGKVCLNILREDWKPVLDINSVIYGLIYLFYEPNPDDPLNHEAAELFRKDVRQFERLVSRTLRGGILDGVQFERLV